MSIVLAIIGVIIAGGAVTFTASLKRQQNEETFKKMEIIQKALTDYWRTFGRLPCPANLSLYNVTDDNFGKEAGTTLGCTGTPAASYVYNITDNDSSVCIGTEHCVDGGMVPTKTLRLPDDLAFDGWGRRIDYYVDNGFSAVGARASFAGPDDDVNSGITRISIMAVDTITKTTAAAYVVLSYGENGHGAYPRYTTTVTVQNILPGYDAPLPHQWADNNSWISMPSFFSDAFAAVLSARRINSALPSNFDLENCDCDGDGQMVVTGFNAAFYQLADLHEFDDILRFDTLAGLWPDPE